VVTGYFDPLVAAHANRLRELADSSGWLVAALTEPERPILTAQARAVLVAALASIDCVVVSGARTAGEVLRQVEPDEIYSEEADDERRTQELMLHVQGRHI